MAVRTQDPWKEMIGSAIIASGQHDLSVCQRALEYLVWSCGVRHRHSPQMVHSWLIVLIIFLTSVRICQAPRIT
ncbi:hypothetical protein AKL17_3p0067 (plasmid) [Frigidibacter mobilis]|uniref:Uncharacterized protein n=1 Tax=Frigidibacter mobilis TaxID=1335048 RepID=A0A161GN16_9RHOB|nr:hypothetical protein AKL17_3p0067 [Frigidibacter mobilis]